MIAEICTRSSREAWSHFPPRVVGYLEQRGGTPSKLHWSKIPVLVVVCYEVSAKQSRDIALASTWAAIENMLLATTAEGLAGCPYSLYDSNEEEALKEVLNVPQEYHVAAILQLGFGSTRPPPPSPKRIEEIVSYQHF